MRTHGQHEVSPYTPKTTDHAFHPPSGNSTSRDGRALSWASLVSNVFLSMRDGFFGFSVPGMDDIVEEMDSDCSWRGCKKGDA